MTMTSGFLRMLRKNISEIGVRKVRRTEEPKGNSAMPGAHSRPPGAAPLNWLHPRTRPVFLLQWTSMNLRNGSVLRRYDLSKFRPTNTRINLPCVFMDVTNGSTSKIVSSLSACFLLWNKKVYNHYSIQGDGNRPVRIIFAQYISRARASFMEIEISKD